jgi:Flp pilus assembly protein TadG
MRITKGRLDAERGAVLLHVAISMLVLIGLMTFVADWGVLWVARNQAQNSADAGALAGAVAIAFDANGWSDRTVNGPARQSAQQVALTNAVFGVAPNVVMATDVYFTDQPADMCPADANGLTGCIRVDVYRNQARGNALPSIFGQVFGLTAHGVRATATARVAVADSSDCLKPWAIADKWIDNNDVTNPIETNPPQWTDDDEFDTVDRRGNPLPNPDVYVPPTPGDLGTGFRASGPNNDLGIRITLKFGNPANSANAPISPGTYQPVRIPTWDGVGQGGADYQANIATCNGVPVGIGDVLESEQGAKVGPTNHGMEDLIALDPYAQWDSTSNSVINSCQTANPSCGRSQRIIAIPVYDPALFESTKRQGLPQFRIVNILGFFIDRMQGQDVVGYLTEMPGLVRAATAPINPNSSFLTQIQLIR